MNKISTLLSRGVSSFLLALAVVGASAQQDDTVIYGSVLSSMNWGEGLGPGLYSFGATTGTAFTPVKVDDRLAAQGGGVYANGKYYSINADTKTLSVYDADTWELLSSKPVDHVALDLTYDPTTDSIYGCFVDNGAKLGVLLPETGGYRHVADLNGTLTTLSCTADGQLYAISSGMLCTVDKETGDLNYIGSVGIYPMYVQSATIDPTTGKCYWASMQADFTSALYEVNLETAECTLCKSFPGQEEISGLYILPHVSATAPAKVADLRAAFDGGSTQGTVSFTMPQTTKGGAALDASVALTYTVTVGDISSTGSAKPGAHVSLPQTLSRGQYKVVVTTTNVAGEESERAVLSLWVGNDSPAAVTGLTLKRTSATGLSLTWNAVDKGAHGGHLDASKVTYKVVRHPDGQTVASALNATTLTETYASDTLANVWYDVTASAESLSGDSTLSNKVVLGPGMDVPYTEDFSAEAPFDYYTVKDVNADGKTWYYSATYGSAQYAGDAQATADDWLMLPPLSLSNDDLYKVSFDVRCNSQNTHRLSLSLGQLPEVEAMTTTLIAPTDVATNFESRTMEAKFHVAQAGDYNLGFHLQSEALMHSFDVDNIRVTRLTSAAAPAAVSALTVTPAAKGALKADLSFRLPEQTIAGKAVGTLTKAELSRGGTVIRTWDSALTPGATLTATDESPVNGNNTYKVVVYNAAGQGNDTTATVYVGVDTPAAVQHITAEETVDGTVTLHWDAPTTGANGGYVDPSLLTYTVKRNGWKLIGDTLTACTVSDVIDDLGDAQRTIGYTVNAYSVAGMSADAYSPYLSVGRPYATPFEESFVNGSVSHGEWTTFPVMSSRSWAASYGTESYDGDNGCIAFSNVSTPDESVLMSPKVQLDNTVHPVLSFWTKHSAIDDQLQVVVYTPDSQQHDLLSVDLSTETDGWKEYTADLSDYVGYRYVQLGFRTDNVTKNASLRMDAISVTDNLDYNLALESMKVASRIKAGEENAVKVTVSNVGRLAVDNYSVVLYSGDRRLTQAEGTALAAGEDAEVLLSITPAVADQPTLAIRAELVCDLDQNPRNDTLSTVCTVVAPDYPVATRLQGTWDGSSVYLSWKAPNTADAKPEAVTEDFEGYEAFTISDFGDWTTASSGGRQFTQEFQTSDGRWITYTNSGDSLSYQVIDLSQIIATEKDGWSSVSGDKILISPYRGLDKQDWMISPALYGGAQTITIHAKSLNFQHSGLETFYVFYSTDGNTVNDFINIDEVNDVPEAWTEYTFDLPEGTKYFAICASEVNSAIFFDDISYIPAGSSSQTFDVKGYNVYRDGQLITDTPVTTTLFTDNSVEWNKTYTYRVTVVYDKGESDFSDPLTLSLTTGIDETMSSAPSVSATQHTIHVSHASGNTIEIWTADGKQVCKTSGHDSVSVPVASGCYLVKVGSRVVKVLVP